MSRKNKLHEISNLDHYLSLLMRDDNALEFFITNPSKAEDTYGVTKAERAVLRRVVSGLSHQSKNGFSIRRDYGSYRRSLRLLQNVLHKHSSAQLIKHHAPKNDAVTTGASVNTSMYIYFTGNPSIPGAPYYNPSIAYNSYVSFIGPSTTNSTRSIGEAMYFSPPSNPYEGQLYTTLIPSSASVRSQYGDACLLKYQCIFQNGAWYVISFILAGSNNSNLQNGPYQLIPGDNNTRLPFWYFSVNGNAIAYDPSAIYDYSKTDRTFQGYNGQSFTNFNFYSNEPVYWQAIAPDHAYGYAHCFSVKPDYSKTS
jgi:hypothetical protein